MQKQENQEENNTREFVEKFVDFQKRAEDYLQDIPEDLKNDFYKFCTGTKFGNYFVEIETPGLCIMFWFGVFGEPFKDVTFRNRFDDVLNAIYSFEYDNVPDFRSEFYGYSQLFEAVYYLFSGLVTEKKYSNIQLYTLFAEAEIYCRKSIRYLDDLAFISVVACRYMESLIHSSLNTGDDELVTQQLEAIIEEIRSECLSTYFNLSQRNDLLSETQMQVLGVLNRVVERTL